MIRPRMVLCVVCVATAVQAETIGRFHVVNDRAPDCSSLPSIVESVTRDCETDDERAIAIYNFSRYAYYHFAYPREKDGIGTLKMINVYGWGLCGGQHAVLSSLWEAAGWQWRFRGWPGHTTVEAFYGGRWHFFDTFLKFYTWMPDPGAPGGRTIAGQLDINANPELVNGAFVFDQARKVWYRKGDRFDYIGDKANWTAPAFMVCGDSLPGVIKGCAASRRSGSPRGWGGMRFDEEDYSTDVNLGVGYSLTLDWDHQRDAWYHEGKSEHPRHTCGDKDYRNCPAIGPILEPYLELDRARSYSNGTLLFEPDMATPAFLSSLYKVENVSHRGTSLVPTDPAEPGVIVIEMASPYVVTVATGEISSPGATFEVSLDGENWKAVDIADFTASVRGSYRYLLRATFTKAVQAISVKSVVQHNQESLPYLAPGRNKITVTASNSRSLGDNRVAVTYAYCLGWRDRTPEEICDRGAEIARAHYATWSSKPIVVQKVFDRLPASFEIPIPAPNGKQPVYPRMVFLRREVLGPSQKPLPTPVSPSEPKVGDGEFLARVPNPWMIGTQKPPAMESRETTATVLPPKNVNYVSKSGGVFSHQFVKWLKDSSEAWIFLADFDTTGLPEVKQLASAKLIVHVIESHDKAPMQAAAVDLTAPFTTGDPYDFKNLGDTIGWTIIAKSKPGSPRNAPPLAYEIDVTSQVRAWIRGDKKPHGIALRIIPNRGVDDGWTVRFTPDREKPVQLKIETFSEIP
jgi:hypothetical protein